MKKRWPFSFLTVLLLLTQGIACDSQSTDSADGWARSLESLRQVDDFPLYVMDYYGDYSILADSPVASRSGWEMSIPPRSLSTWGCTCFSALNDGGDAILGRNFDWYDHPALLLFADPPDRYASVSMVDLSYLGYAKEDSPLQQPDGLRNIPYFPFDGMNEHGLSVGIMAVSEAQPPFDPEKHTIGSLHVIRIILDCARNVDEAITVFRDYNIDFTGGPPLHYMIMDASRESAVIELLDNKIMVLRNDSPWQVATNFLLTGLSEEERRASCPRYLRAYDALAEKNGHVSIQKAMMILEDVSQSNTIWSVVYNAETHHFHVAMGKMYSQLHEFEL